MNNPVLGRWLTLGGYFGLMLALAIELLWLAPHPTLPRSLVFAFMVGPLLLPLRGLLHGRVYTHQWAGFLALAYFVVLVSDAWADDYARGLALIEVGFAVIFFIGTTLYPRQRQRQRQQEAEAQAR